MGRLDFPADDGRCRDCGAAISGPYCGQCGARLADRLDARALAGEIGGRLCELDFPLLHTLRGLLLHPGATLRDYLQGRRHALASPLRFFFVWVTVSVALTLLLGLPHSPRIATAGLPAATAASLREMPEFVFALRAYLGLFALMPVAWLCARLYRHHDLRTAEAMALLLYAGGVDALLQMPVSALLHMAPAAWFAIGRLAVWMLVLAVFLHALLDDRLWSDLARAAQLAIVLLALLSVLGGSAFLIAESFGLRLG